MVVYGLEHPKGRELAYHLLDKAARLHWGLRELPELARGEHGKPYFPQKPGLHFNLSHSGSFALCALSDVPVGVDIQVVRPRRAALLGRVCSPEERDWLRAREDTAEAFALLWAMKEARCKHSGRGLTKAISEISVPLPEHGEELLERDGLRFYLRSGPGWQMCLCGTGDWDGTIHWMDEIEEGEI